MVLTRKAKMSSSAKRTEGSAAKRAQNWLRLVPTKVQHFVNYFVETNDHDEATLRFKVQKLEKLYTDFNKYQNDLECNSEYSHDEDNDEIESMLEEILVKARKELEKFNKLQSTSSQNEGKGSIRENFPQLEKIKLPKFNGEFQSWLSFRDTFRALVHENKRLSNVEKFIYMKNSLTGDASNVLKQLEVSSENYDTAFVLLHNRFESKPLLINAHIKSLYNVTIRANNPQEIRNFVDRVRADLRSLQSLGQNIDNWDTLLLYQFHKEIGKVISKECEHFTSQSVKEFLQDLESRAVRLELQRVGTQMGDQTKSRLPQRSFHLANQSNQNCLICNEGEHKPLRCTKFEAMSIADRRTACSKLKLCFNCLKKGHSAAVCRDKIRCSSCAKRHSTMLHVKESVTVSTVTNKCLQGASTKESRHVMTTTQTILPTAVIRLIGSHGREVECRALLDTGSQSNFISFNIAKQLGLKWKDTFIPIKMIKGKETQVTKTVTCEMKSHDEEFSTKATFLILNHITNNIPQSCFRKPKLSMDLKFADPKFNEPGRIDVIIGAAIFWEILKYEKQPIIHNGLRLIPTELGWLAGGIVSAGSDMPIACNFISTQVHSKRSDKLHHNLEKFWKLEDVENKRHLSSEERAFSELFQGSVEQDSVGRLIVPLALKDSLDKLGNTRKLAEKRFYRMEKRFSEDDKLGIEYKKFMYEYITLGHMKQVDNFSNHPVYYYPHHAVFKEENTTRKIRVVFDGSAKGPNGMSLNDILMSGPMVQSEIFDILLRFRKYNYVLVADIEKMYRQINIRDVDKRFQRILWRFNAEDPLQEYELQTVTYGSKSAPFLATHCINYIGEQCKGSNPVIGKIIQDDIYVDDIITGTESKHQLHQLKNELENEFNKYCMQLRKWSSNEGTLRNSNPQDVLSLYTSERKTLGLVWEPELDHILYRLEIEMLDEPITKRHILSKISRLFDPLGLVSPVIVTAKLIMQELWKDSAGWDEPINIDIMNVWKEYYGKLDKLRFIQIPRQVLSRIALGTVEIHGFADASERAYGAAIYLRSGINTYIINLLCAKSKIAPLKTISLPRLELCAALLLSKLYNRVKENLNLKIKGAYLWTDSTIVLNWINDQPYRWQNFVANRTSEIQNLTPDVEWRHVNSSENPADIVSRGLSPEQLKSCELWWKGPPWLSKEPSEWPNFVNQEVMDMPEQKHQRVICMSLDQQKSFISVILNKYSTLSKIIKIIAYCFRFKYKMSGLLQVEETDRALNAIIRLSQAETFSLELKQLQKGNSISSKSKLLELNIFLDEFGIIRVGGRLGQSNLPYEQRNPIILSGQDRLSILIIRQYHHKLLHMGTQALLSNIRTKYWLLKGKIAVKRVLRTCVTCFRAKPKVLQQIMSELPSDRISPARPFSIVGIDFAGPMMIKDHIPRSKTRIKSYIAIFVCFVTKAVHIELVLELSTKAFLNALKRFVGRRGLCSHIYSDNGTNFIGAKRELKECYEFMKSNQTNPQINNWMIAQDIKWKTITPRSPHQGGLWEAAVKSTKYHLVRTIGETCLTYEELYTILVQIESCLNSRPIFALSSDPDDLSCLTPAHFLIGSHMYAMYEANVNQIPINRLDRYQLLTKMFQDFWKRWSIEYLGTLQIRSKWLYSNNDILNVNDIVIIKEDNLPPLKWQLARVISLHPGKDDKVRIVSLKTQSGKTTRAIQKLCLLPKDIPLSEGRIINE